MEIDEKSSPILDHLNIANEIVSGHTMLSDDDVGSEEEGPKRIEDHTTEVLFQPRGSSNPPFKGEAKGRGLQVRDHLQPVLQRQHNVEKDPEQQPAIECEQSP